MKLACFLLWACFVLIVGVQGKEECRNASDCDPHHCCMEGRRALKRFIFDSKGTCRHLRQANEQCDPFGATSRDNPNLYVIECPCDAGLVCNSTDTMPTAHNSFCV